LIESSIANRSADSAGIPQGLKAVAAIAALPVSVVINIAARTFTDFDTAALIAAGIPGAAFAVLEYMSRRRQPAEERIRAAIEGSYYKHPLLVAVYVVFALQICQAVISFLVGFGAGAALAPYDLSEEDKMSVALTTATVVVLPVVAVLLVFIARAAAHRIERHEYAWLALALLMNLALNLVTGLAVIGPEEFTFSAGDVVVIAIVNIFYFGAAWIGVRWGERTQALHVLSQAYRDLSPQNRAALVELAMPNVETEGTTKA
jgi:hypothetical protein